MLQSVAQHFASNVWWRFERPFQHIIAENVFDQATFQSLSESFRTLLNVRASSFPPSGYDAITIPFNDADKEVFNVFLCEQWLTFSARLFGLNLTADFDGGIHHHRAGSASGWVHNDLNPGWFCESTSKVNLADRSRCNYRDGTIYIDGVRPVRRVRAVTMIYFLENGPWSPEDGGETGIYEHRIQAVDQPTKRIPPTDNSMLLFECTPFSYHSFIHNPYKQRNSIILWLHQDWQTAAARWGESSIVGWN